MIIIIISLSNNFVATFHGLYLPFWVEHAENVLGTIQNKLCYPRGKKVRVRVTKYRKRFSVTDKSVYKILLFYELQPVSQTRNLLLFVFVKLKNCHFCS